MKINQNEGSHVFAVAVDRDGGDGPFRSLPKDSGRGKKGRMEKKNKEEKGIKGKFLFLPPKIN